MGRYEDLFDHYLDEEPECPNCKEVQKDKEHAAYYFKKIVEILYSQESINIFELDSAISELGCYLSERDIPSHLPPVVRMAKEQQHFLHVTSDQVKSV